MIKIGNKNNLLIRESLLKINQDIFIIKENHSFSISMTRKDNLFSILPRINFKNTFTSRFNTKFPYMAGAMAKGISSKQMLTELSDSGFLGIFGSAGLSNEKIINTAKELKSNKINFGVNLINIPGNQENEINLILDLIKNGVDKISAGAYIKLTPGLVLFRVKGLKKDANGKIYIKNNLIAKLSRKEIAKRFMSPPPARIIKNLLDRKLITKEEALLAESIPMTSSIIAEADSGGHTDKQPAISLLPEILYLRDKMKNQYDKAISICIGLGGGIATPESALAAFSMGADFIVTGSINQSCIESGTSNPVREILSMISQSDFSLAPSADTFELGGRVQVVKKKTKFSSRAKFLEKMYHENSSLNDIKEEDKKFLEEKIFRKDLESEWQTTLDFFQKKGKPINEDTLTEKQKMALLFKSYLGQSSWWAIN